MRVAQAALAREAKSSPMPTRLGFVQGALALAATPAAVRSAAPAPTTAAFEPSAMAEDLRAFARGLEEVGAEPFRTSSREAFVSALARAEAACARPRTAEDFYVALAGAAASLNDGHVSVEGWKSRAAHDDAGGGEFPLRTALDDDEALVVLDDVSDEGGVEPGTLITRIDGHDARDVVARAIGLHGGQTAALRRAFARLLDAIYLIAGPHAAGQPYEVELVDAAGARRVRKLAAVTAKARNERYAAKAPAFAPYTDRGMVRGAAVCDYNSCRDGPKFREFLTGFMARARVAKARAVVFDIRRNGGGNSAVNDELFAFVTAKKYRQFGGMRVRASERLKREYGQAKYTSAYGDKAWAAKDGELVEYAFDPPRAPRDEPGRFAGPAYLLIGSGTFSSAMSCASAAKAYGLMQLAGQETGEPVYSTGEIYELPLVRTGFSVFVTTKVFLPPEPLPADAGVRPDIVVATTRADRRAGRDPVLETVLARLA
jgi:C-terminal processing protease CtpA/Prc